MTHEQESKNYPKIIGNMVVLQRCPEHGYKLMCSCEHVFNYVPGKVNSVSIAVEKMGRCKAMCPKCKALWFEDAKMEMRKSMKPFAVFVLPYTAQSEQELKFEGLGRAYTQIDAINIAANGLRDDPDIKAFIVKFLTDEEHANYKEAQDLINNKKSLEMLAALMSTSLGDLRGQRRGRKPDP